jgi:hypothetical protein
MAAAVLARLREHPLLQPLRDAGEPALVSRHVRAIWADALPLGGGQYQLTMRIEHEEWWEPRLYTFEEHARRLAGYLAREIWTQWDRVSEDA